MSDNDNMDYEVVEEAKKAVNLVPAYSIPVDAFLQKAFDGIVAIDTDQNIIAFNDGAERLFGYTSSQLIGQKIDVLIPTRFIEQHRKHVEDFLQSEDLVRPSSGDLRVVFGRHKDGHDIPLEALFCKSIPKEPQPITMTVFLRDINSRQQAKIALQQQEVYFRALVEESSEAIMLFNIDGIPQYISPSAEKVLGVKLDTLKRNHNKSYLHDDDVHVLDEAIKSVVTNPSQVSTVTYRVRQKEGGWRWIKAVVKNLVHDLQVGAIVVNNSDITEYHNTEQALRETETRFRQLFNASPIPTGLNRLSDGRHLDVNDAFCEFTGWTREETIGKTSIELGIWADETDRNSIMDKLRSGRSLRNVESRIRIRSGEVRNVLHSMDIMEIDGTECVIVSATDVTEQQRAISLIKRHNRLLNTLSAVNELLLQESDTQHLFEETCRIIIDKTGYSMAWVGIADLDQGTVTPVAEAGFNNDYLSRVTIRCDDSPWGRGPSGTAIRENHAVVIADTDTDPRFEVWRELAREYGYRSCVSVPLSQHDRVYGGLNIYSTNANDFDPDTLILLERMSADLGLVYERLEMKKRLQQSEIQLKTILDHSPALISIKDAEGNFLLANRRFEILGLPPTEQIIGKNISEVFSPGEAKSIRKSELMVQNAGEPIETEELLIHRDGSRHTYLSIKFPVELAGEESYGICSISTDITEYKKSQKALDESETRLASFFSEAPAGLVLYDKDLRFIKINPTLAKSGNLSPEELIGKRPSDILPLPMANIIEESVREVFASGESCINEEVFGTIPSAANEVRHWMHSHFPVSDTEGKVSAVGGFVIETTVLKQAEQALKQINQELEIRVNQRTAALAAANAELESFAYSVSHDLRAPLRSIDGFSRILLEDYNHKLDTEGQEHLDRIIKAVNRMGALIDAMLALSRLSRRELDLQDIGGDKLASMVKEITLEIDAEDTERKIEWNINPLSHCYADPILLRQVWSNLLRNAAKFSSGVDHPKVCVGMLDNTEKKIYYVRDNGIGFDMKYAEKLFGVFQRLHRLNEFEGTGIGLATVKRIIGMLGGQVWADGEVNKGATFYFTLP